MGRGSDVKHLGDICKINGADIEPVDVITFGSPCQDLSIAGTRAGLHDGKRSNLFFEAIRIIKEMREATDGEYPKFAVWENVPGAFSSNKGHDFYAVLQAFCSVADDTVSIPEPYDGKRPDKLVWKSAGEIVGDNFSIAWRVLDAQYWGVPQRRKRIYLVADFTGRRAGEILFKPESLRGHLETSDEAWKETACDAVGGADRSVGAVCGVTMCFENHQHGGYREGCGTLRASGGDYGGGSENVVCYDARGNGDGETACTITGDHQNRITDYTAVTVCKTNPPRKYIIRRLTPTECARLQGFPDDWGHLAPYNPDDAEFWEQVRKTHAEVMGKSYKPMKDLKKWYESLHTDSAEYKMWGNGIALPCAEYVLRGIAEHGAKTLGSLFDGSGGFPLAGVRNGITPVWASEIEPYPIAVTRSRFGG